MCLFLFNPSKCQRENYYKSGLSAAKTLETVQTKTIHVKHPTGPTPHLVPRSSTTFRDLEDDHVLLSQRCGKTVQQVQ